MGEAYACRLKFRKQMVLSDRSCQIRTRELEEEDLRNDRTIETNQRRTAISRVNHCYTTGASKIRKQMI